MHMPTRHSRTHGASYMRRPSVSAALALAVACGLLAIKPPRALADVLVAQTAEPTPVSAYGEVLAWSAYEDGNYRLMVKVGGNIDPVSTPPEPRAFDASVDLSQSKTPVVLFSRCRRYNNDPSQLLFGEPASGCRVYRYDVGSGVVAPMTLGQRPGESFTDPVSGNRVSPWWRPRGGAGHGSRRSHFQASDVRSSPVERSNTDSSARCKSLVGVSRRRGTRRAVSRPR